MALDSLGTPSSWSTGQALHFPINPENPGMDFGHLPKVELHLHLDCSLSFTVVSTMAPRVTLKEYREKFTGPAKCTNLADFLTRAQEGVKVMQSERQLRLVTRD